MSFVIELLRRGGSVSRRAAGGGRRAGVPAHLDLPAQVRAFLNFGANEVTGGDSGDAKHWGEACGEGAFAHARSAEEDHVYRGCLRGDSTETPSGLLRRYDTAKNSYCRSESGHCPLRGAGTAHDEVLDVALLRNGLRLFPSPHQIIPVH